MLTHFSFRIFAIVSVVLTLNACATSSSSDGESAEGDAVLDSSVEPLPESSDVSTEQVAEDANDGSNETELGAPAEVSEEVAAPSEALSSDDTSSMKLEEEAAPIAAVEEAPVMTDNNSPQLDMEQPVTEAPEVAKEPTMPEVAPASAGVESTQTLGDSFVYMVNRGESLSAIAGKFLGGVKNWKSLASFNKISNPNRVDIGRIIRIPVTSDNQATVEQFIQAHEQSVSVRRGDTLAKIAKRVLGTPRGWRYLWKYNSSVVSNPNKIEVGMQLKYISRGNKALANQAKNQDEAAH